MSLYSHFQLGLIPKLNVSKDTLIDEILNSISEYETFLVDFTSLKLIYEKSLKLSNECLNFHNNKEISSGLFNTKKNLTLLFNQRVNLYNNLKSFKLKSNLSKYNESFIVHILDNQFKIENKVSLLLTIQNKTLKIFNQELNFLEKLKILNIDLNNELFYINNIIFLIQDQLKKLNESLDFIKNTKGFEVIPYGHLSDLEFVYKKDILQYFKISAVKYTKFGNQVDELLTNKALKTDLSFEVDSKREYDLNGLIIRDHAIRNIDGTLYFLFGGWYENSDISSKFKKKILYEGNSYIQYTFSKWLLTSNTTQTLKNFNYILDTFKKDIKNYPFHSIVIVGISLGGIAAFMAANSFRAVESLVLLVPGDKLSSSLWHGTRTQNIRKSFEDQNIDEKKLGEIWNSIEPINNLDNLHNKQILIFNSTIDGIIPYARSKMLIDEMKKRGLKPKVHTNVSLGHYGTIGDFYFGKGYEILNEELKNMTNEKIKPWISLNKKVA